MRPKSRAVESPQRQATKAWAASWTPRERIKNPRLRPPTIRASFVKLAMRAKGKDSMGMGSRAGLWCNDEPACQGPLFATALLKA
jgi:hypothetical protein